jgi:hypothetical protein
MFANILRRLGVPTTGMSRGELAEILGSIWNEAVLKLQSGSHSDMLSPANSIVADRIDERKRSASLLPKEERSSSSKRSRSDSAVDGHESVVVATDIIHVKNLSPEMDDETIIEAFRKFGIVKVFWRSHPPCRKFCYIRVI